LKLLNLFIIISLISFLSIILITGSPFKSYTNFSENDNHIPLKTPPIYAQDNDDSFENESSFEEEINSEEGIEEDNGQFAIETEESEDAETEDAETEDAETEDAEERDQQVSQQEQQDAGTDDITEQIQEQAEQIKEQEEEQQDAGTDDITEQIQEQAEQIQEQEEEQQDADKEVDSSAAQQKDAGTDDITEQIQEQAEQIQEQEEEQQAEQQTFSEDIEQKISQISTQISQSTDELGSEESSDVQQVIKQIASQASTDGGDVNQIIKQISTQIINNPKSDLAKSLGNLGGLYGSGNREQVNQATQQIGTQIAIGNNIDQNIIQNIIQKSYQVTDNYFKNKIKLDIDNDRDHRDNDNDNVKIIKKVYKRDNTCPTQSDSIQLKEKILGKGVIVLADFEPCELRDGRATLNIPNNPNLKFVALSIDKKGNEHDGIIVYKQKIQNLGIDSGLYVVNFDDKMAGNDPVTGKKKTLDDINGLALYNTATKSLIFKSGNSLALTAVLK
jgi:hypothetical protein